MENLNNSKIEALAAKFKNPKDFINELNKILIPQNNLLSSFGKLIINKTNALIVAEKYTKVALYLMKIGQNILACEVFICALKNFETAEDFFGIAGSYNNIGFTKISTGEYNLAQANFELAKKYAEKILDINDKKRILASTYCSLGNVQQINGDFGGSIDGFKKALTYSQELNDSLLELKCLILLCNTFYITGEFQFAIGYLETGINLCANQNTKTEEFERYEATCYTNLANIYILLGYHKDTLKLSLNNTFSKNILDSISKIDNTVIKNDSDIICGLIKYSLSIYKKLNDLEYQAHGYNALGIFYRNLGNKQNAIDCFNETIKIHKQISNRLGIARGLINLGNVYNDSSDFVDKEKGIDLYRESIIILNQIGYEHETGKCYLNMGSASVNTNRIDEAYNYYINALNIFEKYFDFVNEWEVRYNLAMLHGEYKNDNLKAYEECKKSIEKIEIIFKRLISDNLKISLSEKINRAYHYIILLCLRLNKNKEALNYLERSKSRSFLDLISKTEIKPQITNSEINSLLDKEKKVLDSLNALQTETIKGQSSNLSIQQIENLNSTLDDIYNKLNEYIPEYVNLRKGNPCDSEDIINILHDLKEPTILIEIFIANSIKCIYFFILKSDSNELTVIKKEYSSNKLKFLYEQFLKEVHLLTIDSDDLNRLSFSRNVKEGIKNFDEFFILPISDFLIPDYKIIFVPHLFTHYFPFHSFEFEDLPLINSCIISYLPSASFLKYCNLQPNLGFKTISYGVDCEKKDNTFEQEAINVSNIMNGKYFIGDSVTKDLFIQTYSNSDIIHISCHGVFKDEPLKSCLYFNNEEELTASEIFSLKINARLVTLSACQTGLNLLNTGDDLMGLSRAFFYAGARAIIVTLWKVNANTADELMFEFYSNIKNGLTNSKALHQAQKKLYNKNPIDYDWAAFILIGID